MIRRPPRSTQGVSSAASDVYKRQREDLAPEDLDGIRPAGNVGQFPPPPMAGLNPFTPEWFAQIIGAAATAAATAVATANATSSSSRPAPHTPSSDAAPRCLNDRKVPDFWEDRPEYWFRIFDAHLAHFNPTEKRCFDALLPCLLYTSPSPRDGLLSRMPSSA